MNIHGFHAHVYFNGPAQRDEAIALRATLHERAPSARLGRVHERPVAFHPSAMYQVEFSPEQFGELVPWLMLHRGSLSVMVHPLTGDTWAEHTQHSLWLGPPLPLDLDHLRAAA